MLNNTEAIYAALFAKFSGLTPSPFVTTSRRIKNFSAVTREQMPALYMVEGDQESDVVRRGIPTKWKLYVELWMYFWQEDNTVAIMPSVNPILDSVRACLAPDDSVVGELTLQGLVSHCRMIGKTRIWEGANDGNLTVVMIPIEMMLAA
jgi:hypothetical protein